MPTEVSAGCSGAGPGSPELRVTVAGVGAVTQGCWSHTAKAGMGRSLSALSALICGPACNLPEFKERLAACLCQERSWGSFM